MIAITGANGLLGSYLVREMIARGESFIALKRKNSDTSMLADVQDRITWRDADVLDPETLMTLFASASTVIHAAGFVSYFPRDKKKIFEINVDGTRNVVNAALESGVKHLVHVSSVAALGRPKSAVTLDESQKWVESPYNTPYGHSKYLAELEVFRGAEEGLSTTIVNPSVILAPATNRSSARIFYYVLEGGRFYVDGSLNYVDVRDVAAIIAQLTGPGGNGERYIVNAGTVPFQTVLKLIAAGLDRPAPDIRLGRYALAWISAAEQVRSSIFRSNPLITKQTALLAKSQVFFSNDKIREKLDFRFQPIEETVKWCCEHYIRMPGFKKR